MALHRARFPTLVLCGACRDLDAFAPRLVALADAEADGAVLVRDVCAAQDCSALQLRGHLCAEHILEFELAWLHHIPVRACHGCRISVIELYAEQREVWFVLPPSDEARRLRGVETKPLDTTRLLEMDDSLFQSPVRSTKGKARMRTSSGKKRRSARAQHLSQRQKYEQERLRAREWSLGNIPRKLFLWMENKRRLEAEKNPPPSAFSLAMEKEAANATAQAVEGPVAYPEPLMVLCVVPMCRFYAKSGERCRFHSRTPLRKWGPQRTLVKPPAAAAASSAAPPTTSTKTPS